MGADAGTWTALSPPSTRRRHSFEVFAPPSGCIVVRRVCWSARTRAPGR